MVEIQKNIYNNIFFFFFYIEQKTMKLEQKYFWNVSF